MKEMETSPIRFPVMVWGLVACFLLALALATWGLVWNVNKSALHEREDQVSHFVAGAESSMTRALLGLDVLLASTDEMLGLSKSSGAAWDAAAASQQLRRAARQNLMVRQVVLMDAAQRVLASSEPVGQDAKLELPEGFAKEVMARPLPSLVMSAPDVNASSFERVVYVGRQIRSAQGTLLAVAQVPTTMLASVLMQSVDIPGMEVTLERLSGELLLGVPEHSPRTRAEVASVALWQGEEGSHWERQTRLSGVPGLVVVQPLMYEDLSVTASLPREAAFLATRSELRGVLAAAVAFALMIVGTGALVHANLARIHAARQMTAASKAALDQALGSMVSGFLLLDAQHCVVQWNQRYEEMFPWLLHIMKPGVPFAQVLLETSRRHIPGATEAQSHAWITQRLAMRDAMGSAHDQHLPNGRTLQIVERATPEGGLVITYEDVTALRRASAEAEALAFYDPLTGLPNRRLLLDRLSQAAQQSARSGQIGALLFLDLDHFKVLNDTQGHEMGDQLLQQVARRLKGTVRSSDTVSRLGGDEFVVMLLGLSSEPQEAQAMARHIGEEILKRMGQPYVLAGRTHRGGCSVGGTLFGLPGVPVQSAAELLKQADIAMYQVKARRSADLCFFDPRMQVEIMQRADLEADLQMALVENQFVLHYQPQFTHAGEMVGVEALLRWQHPQKGLVPPGDFISVAEDSGLIVPMGLWALRQACTQLVAWQGMSGCERLQMSVNVSARQFRQPDFVARAVAIVQQTGVKAHLLKLELTESLVLDDVADSIAKMHELRTKGVRFAMDDFGTGHSSLAYLTRLPLDQLKIDQSFVRNLGERHTDDVIVQTIIGMARTLDLEVIAEGVETEGQRDMLASYGCHLYQGYFYGRPMAAEALRSRMEAA
jgi:diguanylate cyclase (GGDEF)-like protein